MHDAYAGKWYKTLSFVQKTSYPDARVETWYEAAEIPGKLRIDVAPIDSMKTILFRVGLDLPVRPGEDQAGRGR